MGRSIQVLKPFLGTLAGHDHRDSVEITGLVLQIQVVELHNLFGRGIGGVAEERENVRRFVVLADVTGEFAFILSGYIDDGNRLCGRTDRRAGNNLSRKRSYGQQSRAEDSLHFPAFSSSLLTVLYFRSSHLNQPPL